MKKIAALVSVIALFVLFFAGFVTSVWFFVDAIQAWLDDDYPKAIASGIISLCVSSLLRINGRDKQE